MAKIYSARPNMEHFNRKRNKKVVLLASTLTTQEKINKQVSCLIEKCDSVGSIEAKSITQDDAMSKMQTQASAAAKSLAGSICGLD